MSKMRHWLCVHTTRYEPKRNEDGNLYIENTKGKKVLAPGSKGSYSFKVYNAGEITLNYSLDINAFLEIDNKKVELIC